jgi:tensin
MLKDKVPGTFIVRDSNSFPGAYGLVLRVSHVPPNVQTKGDTQHPLVRHYLIEPTPNGVKLYGSHVIEPVFGQLVILQSYSYIFSFMLWSFAGSLAAFVYQHSITPLALPCKLLLSETGEFIINAKSVLFCFEKGRKGILALGVKVLQREMDWQPWHIHTLL